MRLRLLLSSYVPLFLLLAIRMDGTPLRVTLLVIALAGALCARSVLHANQTQAPQPLRITMVRDEGAQVAAYLATYLLPFLMVSNPTVPDLIAYAAFLGIVGLIFVRTDFLQVNPLLALAGYRLYQAESAEAWQGFVLSTLPIREHRTYAVVGVLGNRVLVAKNEITTSPTTEDGTRV
jgi:hypothetical protein